MPKKIIFLDISGVLNNTEYLNSDFVKNKDKEFVHDSSKSISPVHEYYKLDRHVNVEALNYLVKVTKAEIVLTSNWRRKRNLAFLKKLLQYAGAKVNVIGQTPMLEFKGSSHPVAKGSEIRAWIRENKDLIGCKAKDWKTYAIIDDKNYVLGYQVKHFFQTDKDKGLTMDIANDIIDFFSHNKR